MMQFYTGGGKRAGINNVDARNFLADAFLNRPNSASVGGMSFAPPPVYHYPEYPEFRSSSRSRSRNRRRRQTNWESDSSSDDFSSHDKKKKRREVGSLSYPSDHEDKKKSAIDLID